MECLLFAIALQYVKTNRFWYKIKAISIKVLQMSLQKKAEMYFQLGHSNVEIARTLKTSKDHIRQMRKRFNDKVKQNKQTETVALPEIAQNLTEIDNSIQSNLPQCKEEEIQELKYLVKRNVLLAHSAVSAEVARRAKQQKLSDEALAVMHRTQLSLFDD